MSSGSKTRTSAATPGSRYEIMRDIICGCSSAISSATDLASIQSRISIGLSLSVGVILPRTDCALFSPKAFVITFLI